MKVSCSLFHYEKNRDRYLTVVADLDTGAVVFVGNGRRAESLIPFFQRLRRSRSRVQAVAMDFSAAYQRGAHLAAECG